MRSFRSNWVEDLLSDNQKGTAILISKQQLEESNDWIVIIKSINSLECLENKDKVLQKWLIEKLKVIAKDKRKSVNKRVNQVLESLTKST